MLSVSLSLQTPFFLESKICEKKEILPLPRLFLFCCNKIISLGEVARKKILHYRQLYINRPDPIAFLPAAADTTGRVYDDFSRLLFLYAHRETSPLGNEIPEESGQFRFLRVVCYTNIKRSVLPLLDPSLVFTPRHSV